MGELMAALQSFMLAMKERLVDIVSVVFPALQMPEDLVRELNETAREYREDTERAVRILLRTSETERVPTSTLLDAMFDLQDQMSTQTSMWLYNYLARPEVVEDMVALMLKRQPTRDSESDARRRRPHAYVACTAIVGGPHELRVVAVRGGRVIDMLLDYFADSQILDPAVAEYATRVLTSLSNTHPAAVTDRLLDRRDFFRSLMRHIALPCVADMFVQMFRDTSLCEGMVPPHNFLVRLYANQRAYDVLVDAFVATCESDSGDGPTSPYGADEPDMRLEHCVSALSATVARLQPMVHEEALAGGPCDSDVEAFTAMNFFLNSDLIKRVLRAAVKDTVRNSRESALLHALGLARLLLGYLPRPHYVNENGSADSFDHHSAAIDMEGGRLFDELHNAALFRRHSSGKAPPETELYEQCLCSSFSELSGILARHIASTRRDREELVSSHLGRMLLQMVDIFACCFRSDLELDAAKESIYRLGIHAQLYELVALHPSNSVLHHMIESIVETAIFEENSSGRVEWIEKFGLVDKLLDAWAELEAPAPVSKAACDRETYRSAVFQLLFVCWEAVNRADDARTEFRELLSDRTLARFTVFCEKDLTRILEAETAPLAGAKVPNRPHQKNFHEIRNSLGGFSRLIPSLDDSAGDSDDEEEAQLQLRKRASSRLRTAGQSGLGY